MKQDKWIPKDGIEGLKENFNSDALSGLLVFLLALPLSLGIAKASEFPAIYGVLTAAIGGVLVSLISGSRLTIKGPAAGLIVIVSGAVLELGHGDKVLGWHLALGAIVVAGIIQVLFGIMKLGALSDFFPLSAVHGMLAAIGIIIISKQFHVVFGISPVDADGKAISEPLMLLAAIPSTIMKMFSVHKDVAIVGLASLIIVFGWPMIKSKITKKIPAPLVVLVVAIPLSKILGVHNIAADAAAGVKEFKPLIGFDKGLLDILAVNVSFDGMSQTGTFIKFVIMFALVGSLESLLTVKAIDMLDPWKRKSNSNKDLIAIGVGNIVSATLGGLPMISEVARSSANVANGAKTRWANFFHGIFIVLFLAFAVVFSNMIPFAALAAMLIGVGFRLANPKEFGHMAKIGWEQLVIFVVTILVTLSTDLLMGIGAGILVKIIFHLVHGAPFASLFSAKSQVDGHTVKVKGAAVFTNFLGIKKQILKFPYNVHVTLDVRECQLVDHTVIENLYHMREDFKNEGGELTILGLDEFKPVTKSTHARAAMKKARAI